MNFYDFNREKFKGEWRAESGEWRVGAESCGRKSPEAIFDMSIVILALRIGGDDTGYIRVQIDVFGGESRLGEFAQSAHGDTVALPGVVSVGKVEILQSRYVTLSTAAEVHSSAQPDAYVSAVTLERDISQSVS